VSGEGEGPDSLPATGAGQRGDRGAWETLAAMTTGAAALLGGRWLRMRSGRRGADPADGT
jgi:hypothetical protein